MDDNNSLSSPARRPLIVALLVTAGAHGTAGAAVMEELTVTATRADKLVHEVPAAVGVVEQDSIQKARQQLSLDESLTLVPGLFMQNRYNFAQDLRIAIRGFGARSSFGIRGIKILVDGIPKRCLMAKARSIVSTWALPRGLKSSGVHHHHCMETHQGASSA